MNRVRIGVVGLGKMGRHHVRCLATIEGAILAGVMDSDPARSAVAPPEIPFTTELERLFDSCDAVVVAAPSDRHEEIGLACFNAGKHALIEKPLAPTAAQCRRLDEASRRAGLVLAVGHVERWNAAILAIDGRVHAPRFLESDRLAGFDPRGTEVDVVLDLMVHDLDLVLRFVGEEPERVDAVGVAIASDRVDLANARLSFPSGAVANLAASRVSRAPIRKLRVFQSETYFSLDLGAGSAEILRRDATAIPFGVVEEKVSAPEGHNPLVRELQAFAAAVRKEPARLASAAEATRVVETAERILVSIEERWEKGRSATRDRAGWGAPSSS